MGKNWQWDMGVSTLTTKDADGFIGVQVDVYGEKEASTPPFEAFMPPGLYCRPRDPATAPDGTPTLGANVLYAWEGNSGFAFPMHDPRVIAKLPNTIAPGDTVLYCDRDDGQVSMLRLAAKDGAFIVYLPAPNGAGQGIQLRLDPVNGLDLFTPWGRMLLGPLGYHVLLEKSQLNMGAFSGLPGPLSTLTAYASLSTQGVASISGGAVSQGTDGGLANESAVTALLAALTTVVAALLEVSTTPAAIGKPALTPATMAPVTAAFSALQPLINGLGKVV